MSKNDAIKVGLIGTGFMGKTHAHAWRNVQAVMGTSRYVHLHSLCDVPLDQAQKLGAQFGFEHATDDWQALVATPEIDVISITTPNHFHKDMAIAAIEAGKHVWCEKPMALTLEDAQAMSKAARAAGVTTLVGYNYVHNPAFRHAQELIGNGTIGRVVHFRGWVDEDYQADPDLPWTWRAKISDAGLGTLGDLGVHLISMAHGLCGSVKSLIADIQTIHKTRPLEDGTGHAEVENEDVASALLTFESGIQGSVSTSRSAWGRKNRLAWEVHGTKGMICFDQERMNELQLYTNEGPAATQGFKTILTGPQHPSYANFCPAPGHQLGFNDLKIIEAAEIVNALSGLGETTIDFEQALEFEQIIDSIAHSSLCGERVILR